MPYRLKHRLTAIAIAASLLCLPLQAAARWESLRTERTDVHHIARDSDTEIKATRGVLQISTSRPLQVKLFTILGRVVSSETIPAGTSQFIVKAHGVYIVKAGDITCKVSL